MNKMIKGAAFAGIGVALLLGGGGTLAVWNVAKEAPAGRIVSGNLNMVPGAGSWRSNLSGDIRAIDDYRIVPGETLTYSQSLDIALEGDKLEAKLTVTGAGANNGFDPANVTVGSVTLENGSGQVLPSTVLTEESDGTVLASLEFTFLPTVDGRDDVNASYDFNGIGYALEQVAPTEG